jgi:hypothetical protein
MHLNTLYFLSKDIKTFATASVSLAVAKDKSLCKKAKLTGIVPMQK